jgi:hypothetical protein
MIEKIMISGVGVKYRILAGERYITAHYAKLATAAAP